MDRETFMTSVDAHIQQIGPAPDDLPYGVFPLTDEFPIVSPARYQKLLEQSSARLLEAGVAGTEKEVEDIFEGIFLKGKARFGADNDKQKSLCLRIIPTIVMSILTEESALEKEGKKGLSGIPPYNWGPHANDEAVLGYGM